MSKQVIQAIKNRLSREEIEAFCRNMQRVKPIDGYTLEQLLTHSSLGFKFIGSPEGYRYWFDIYYRFSQEELDLVIDIKDLST